MNTNMANPWVSFIALLFATFVTIEAAAFQAPVLPARYASICTIPVSFGCAAISSLFRSRWRSAPRRWAGWATRSAAGGW